MSPEPTSTLNRPAISCLRIVVASRHLSKHLPNARTCTSGCGYKGLNDGVDWISHAAPIKGMGRRFCGADRVAFVTSSATIPCHIPPYNLFYIRLLWMGGLYRLGSSGHSAVNPDHFRRARSHIR